MKRFVGLLTAGLLSALVSVNILAFMQARAIRFASGDDVTLEAWYIPGDKDRPLVVHFHGYVASKSTLLSAARAFHDLGYATLLVDFYGQAVLRAPAQRSA
jgi:cephalosporin-C deacetylase-like acetyl esterase